MKRELLYTREFLRAAKRYAKKHPKAAGGIVGVQRRLDVRIIFSFAKHKKKEAILLETVGSHDEVY